VREFWERHEAWENQLELARRGRRIGDLLVLAEEAPIAAFRAQAWFTAGEALRKAERFRLALEHLERGLAIEPANLRALREQGICLQRLASSGAPRHSLDRARQHYRKVLSAYPGDTETWALLGRTDKDAWTEAWRRPDSTREQMRQDAAYEEGLLRAAIGSYSKSYRGNPAHYYSGINALTLMHLHRHLTDDPRYDADMAAMAGAVRFAAVSEPDEPQLFWSRTTLAELAVLGDEEPKAIQRAYREAIALNEGDWFALHSSRAQLQLLLDLRFHEAAVEAGIDTFDRALERLKRPADRWEPRYVLLFSGHRIDAPGRSPARFPADKEPVAARRMAEVLDQLGAGAEDLAFSQAAAGGDLLFLEACRQRGVRCQVLLPFDEPQFVQRSILPSDGGDRWRERFYGLRSRLQDPPRSMPEELGPLPKGVDPFERCNLWLLYSALACGQEKVRFIALWNGGGGDGRGGTAHLYNEVKDRTGRVTWLDTRQLW
jgi:tetratricopeptide (TPR) repeat protein